MTKLEETVGRLIANERSPFTEDDKEALSAFSEERLSAMEEAYAAPEPVEAEPEKATADEKDEPLTEDEWMAEAPESLRSMVRKYQREEETRRARLVSALAKADGCPFTEDELKAKDVDELVKLSALAKVDEPRERDFSGRGMPITVASEDVSTYAAPDTWGINKKEAN